MKRIIELMSEQGLGYMLKAAKSRLRRLISRCGICKKRIPKFAQFGNFFKSKSGIEIGGPSPIFSDEGFIPLYKKVNKLDGCNFSAKTIWEGSIKQGLSYNYYKDKKGIQYIAEATNLHLIPDSEYDFVISSNCLEHVANPFKAIEEWIRIIKDDGLILLVLPNKEFCFDHKRPVTTFAHLLNDYNCEINEDDLTHLDEILELHDLEMDKPAGSKEQFKERSLKNFENRALHHHIFDIDVLKAIFKYFNLEILFAHEGPDYVVLGKK